MRTYETIFIVHPEKVGDEYSAVVDKFRSILNDQGAEILKVDEWGVRKLAYPIKKNVRGSFVLVAYDADPSIISEFERRLRIDDSIMKYQTVFLEGGLSAAAPAASSVSDAEEEEGEDEETEEEVE